MALFADCVPRLLSCAEATHDCVGNRVCYAARRLDYARIGKARTKFTVSCFFFELPFLESVSQSLSSAFGRAFRVFSSRACSERS